MSNEEFRSDIRECIKSNDVDADDLRSLSEDLERLARQWEQTEDVI